MKSDQEQLDVLSQAIAQACRFAPFGPNAQTLRKGLDQAFQLGASLDAGERARVTEALHALATSLTPPGDPEVQRAYRLQQAARLLARVILESLPNPQIDATDLLTVAATEVKKIVETAQSNFLRRKLTSV